MMSRSGVPSTVGITWDSILIVGKFGCDSQECFGSEDLSESGLDNAEVMIWYIMSLQPSSVYVRLLMGRH